MNPQSVLFPIFAASALLLSSAHAGEFFTLIAKNSVPSASITLNAGDTAELKYANQRSGINLIASIQGTDFYCSPSTDAGIEPVKVVGPASLKMVGINFSQCFATIEVTRAGTASNATAIPQEAGTTWQVILEASTDLVNWTPTAPGDYPSASPQRFFRTRLVKRS
jgi:hypothetical protein